MADGSAAKPSAASAPVGADLVSLLAHELRSPVAAIVGSARTLQGRWSDLSDDQRATFLALILDEANRLESLVRDISDVSRIDSGLFDYTFAEVDANALARAAVFSAVAAHEAAVLIRESEGAPIVRADAARLRQVLANLIDNAVKYSPPGADVEVEVAHAEGRVSIGVTDHGSGIAPDDEAVIFEKFGRVRGPAAKPGTGLGLFIARSIAEAHRGKLEVSSLPGRTTFTLTLPAA
jgi:signal transduction histidine kinase